VSDASRDERFTAPAREEPPAHPAAVGGGWVAVRKRSGRKFKEDNLTDWAAALTYYAVLSIFPGLIVLVSLVGLFGPSATDSITKNLTAVAPDTAKQIVTDAGSNLSKSQGTAGVLFVVGLAVALSTASGCTGAFMRASNAIYKIEEGRPFWKLRPLQLLVTVVVLVLLAAVAVATVLTGDLAKQAASAFGRRRHPARGVEDRQVAGHAPGRRDDARDPLLDVAEREDAEVPLGGAGRARGGRHLPRRLRPLRLLRRALLVLRQDLRLARRRHLVPGVAVDHEPRGALRRRGQRRTRARARDQEAGVPGAHEEIKLEPRSPPKD
jgi:hypothetical protein